MLNVCETKIVSTCWLSYIKDLLIIWVLDTYGAVKNLMNISVYEYLFKQYFIMHFAST